MYLGDSKRASMMPVGDNMFYYFFGAPLPSGLAKTPEEIRDELSDLFNGWPEPVQRLIQRIDTTKTNRLEICDLEPLPRLVRGRVVLVGDAGHATTPTLGQGACQAMEDTVVLSQRLATISTSVEDALKRFEKDRQDRVRALVLKARERSHVIYSKDKDVAQSFYDQLAKESPGVVIKSLAKTILNGPLN